MCVWLCLYVLRSVTSRSIARLPPSKMSMVLGGWFAQATRPRPLYIGPGCSKASCFVWYRHWMTENSLKREAATYGEDACYSQNAGASKRSGHAIMPLLVQAPMTMATHRRSWQACSRAWTRGGTPGPGSSAEVGEVVHPLVAMLSSRRFARSCDVREGYKTVSSPGFASSVCGGLPAFLKGRKVGGRRRSFCPSGFRTRLRNSSSVMLLSMRHCDSSSKLVVHFLRRLKSWEGARRFSNQTYVNTSRFGVH